MRAIIAALIGVAAGALLANVVLLARVPHTRGLDGSPAFEVDGPGEPRLRALAARSGAGVDAEAAPVEPAAIEAELERRAREPSSPSRDLELAALLEQLGDAAPERAVRLAQTLGLDERLVALAFFSWTERDAASALAALGAIEQRATRRAAALAVFDALGGDAAAVDAVAEALPADARAELEADRLGRLAGRDPQQALAAASALADPGAGRLAVQGVLAAWVRESPREALRAAQAIVDPSLRAAAVLDVLGRWAAIDPTAALDALLAAEPRDLAGSSSVIRILDSLAARVPYQLLAVADRLPAALRDQARAAAGEIETTRDLMATVDRIGTLSDGEERDRLIRVAARRYGESDPSAALAWARSLEPPSSLAMTNVVNGIAQRDFDRAIELVFEEGLETSALVLPIVQLRDHADKLPAILDRLVLAKRRGAEALTQNAATGRVLNELAQANPSAAVDWLLLRGEGLDDMALQELAGRLARSNPAVAREAARRMPVALRGRWLGGVVEYLRSDPESARAFIAPFAGEPGYAEWERALSVR